MFTLNFSLVPLFHLHYYVGSSFLFSPFIITDLVNESSLKIVLDALYFVVQSYHLDESDELE